MSFGYCTWAVAKGQDPPSWSLKTSPGEVLGTVPVPGLDRYQILEGKRNNNR